MSYPACLKSYITAMTFIVAKSAVMKKVFRVERQVNWTVCLQFSTKDKYDLTPRLKLVPELGLKWDFFFKDFLFYILSVRLALFLYLFTSLSEMHTGV